MSEKKERTKLGYDTACDRTRFYRNPFDFAIHMLTAAREVDARWKAHTGHDFDEGVRAYRDFLLYENARLTEQVDQAMDAKSEAEIMVASHQEDTMTLTAERDAWKRKEEELLAQLKNINLDLEKARGVESTIQTEVDAARTGKKIMEDELKLKAGEAVDRAYEGYQNGLDHMRFVYDLPSTDYPLFGFDREVKDGKLIWYHSDRKDFDVLYLRSR